MTDNNRALAELVAREFGLRVYGLRREIGFSALSLSLEESLAKALASRKTPVVVADQSDNPSSGGAPGDATFALRWLLDHRAEKVAMAIFYDPEVVSIARKAGKGATLPVRLRREDGAFLGRSSGYRGDRAGDVRGLLAPVSAAVRRALTLSMPVMWSCVAAVSSSISS